MLRDGGCYHCYRCGASGSWYDLRLKMSGAEQMSSSGAAVEAAAEEAAPAVPDQRVVAGYATAAGMIGDAAPTTTPVLGVYGSEDSRLAGVRGKFGTQFANSQLVVFADAPHPCYLRDVAAAKEFTALIVEFVTGDRAAGPGLDVHAAW